MKDAIRYAAKALTLIGVVVTGLLLSACGTPAIAVNATNPGAAVAIAAGTTPTSAPIASAMPSMESMPGMTNPTVAPNPTEPTESASVTVTPGPSPTELVIAWLLYGTPTNTPNSAAQSPQLNASQAPMTPTTGNVQNATPLTVVITQITIPAIGSASPTATQPIAASQTAPVAATTPPAASANTGDPARGKALFQGSATCSSCHDVANGVTIVGPSLKGIASRAGSRIPGKSAAQYLHDHILTPNDFIPPGFQPNVMPSTFGQTLTSQQIDDLVAYLMTLK